MRTSGSCWCRKDGDSCMSAASHSDMCTPLHAEDTFSLGHQPHQPTCQGPPELRHCYGNQAMSPHTWTLCLHTCHAHRPAWVPSAPPMPLHVVDASSLADQASSSTSQVGHPQVLDPAARWRQLISRGDKAQLLAYLKTGTTIQPCKLRRFWSDMLAKSYHSPLYHFSRTGAWFRGAWF